ncbi:MAG: O-methyltransferase [Solirubrobacteraceae bacterium]
MTGGGSSIPEVRRLLMMLVASKVTGRIAEIGTAWGEGALAIASALAPGAAFVTVEPDPVRFSHAREVLAGTRAELINARWQEALPQRGPFDLIFFDGGDPAEIADAVGDVIDLLSAGGILVKDDLTPGIPVETDPMRVALLTNPRLAAVELLVTAEMAVIIASQWN